jgi:hypothetical protein
MKITHAKLAPVPEDQLRNARLRGQSDCEILMRQLSGRPTWRELRLVRSCVEDHLAEALWRRGARPRRTVAHTDRQCDFRRLGVEILSGYLAQLNQLSGKDIQDAQS